MWVIFKRFYSIFLSLSIFISSISFGAIPKNIKMPDLKPGVLGKWVDPFIGTGAIPWANAMLFPGATAPFGMVRLSPDTTFIGGFNPIKLSTSGYFYGQDHIIGFSHTRLSGTGAVDMGHIRVTPSIGDKKATNRFKNALPFSHENEIATAGYYAVGLPSIGALAEMTATEHVGVHKYTFRGKKDAHLFIDATSFLGDGKASEGKVKISPENNEVVGEGRIHTAFTGRYDGLKAYFVARFDKEIKSFSTWSGEKIFGNTADASGNDVGADLNFGNLQNESVELKIGISFVSVENARENLESEAGNLDFEGVRNLMRSTWDEYLSKIKIQTDDEEIKKIFYTALYHTMIMPTNFTDVNGQYLGFNGQIGTADDFTYRTDLSLWDTFRTAHPLYLLIAPDIQRDSLKSLVRMARIGGSLPRWPSGGGYTGSMFGTPADMVIAESYLKGLTDFEVEEAYEFMKKTSEESVPNADSRKGVEEYNELGYCPADTMKYAVSSTLEYAWADGSISLLAKALGKDNEAEYYKNKSMNYKNIFNEKTKYFQPKNKDGSWSGPLLPNMTSYYFDVLPSLKMDDYCEGGPRHWRWSVLQDTKGLIELFGSEDYFVSELDEFMSDASKNRAALSPGGGYWHGNQHDIHAPYLFNDAGRPDLTQKWVRWVLKERHSTDINGLDGNEDGGTLSAWYVFSAMGLYPVAGTDRYWIGSPNVDRAEFMNENGKKITIIAENQSEENIYVQKVTLNGTPLDEMSITHSQIANGGTFVFTMGNTPVK